METLVAKLKELEAKYYAIGSEIKEFQSKIDTLDEQRWAIRDEIDAINTELANLSGALDDDTKYYLYQDLNKIEQLHLAYENDDNAFTLELQNSTEPGYKMQIDCDVTKCKVTVNTASQSIIGVIRKSFTNNPHCNEEMEDSLSRMYTTLWFSGPYGCCSKSFTYDKQTAKSLLCPEDENAHRYSNRGRRRL